jgi:hypothetical protein
MAFNPFAALFHAQEPPMTTPTLTPAEQFTKIYEIIAGIVQFEQTHPDALKTIIAFAGVIKSIIDAFQTPPAA